MIDSSDKSGWAKDAVTILFMDEITSLRDRAFRSLLNGGAHKHDENSAEYKAYEKVLKKVSEYSQGE